MSESNLRNCGGAAPAERRCHYTLSNGQTCGGWAVRGHEHCQRHQRYIQARPDRPIDVPLLEDEGSIVYVLSQTAQALAWGTMPTSNGQGILAICRQAHAVVTTRLEMARLRLRARRMGMSEEELFGELPAEGSPAAQEFVADPPVEVSPAAEPVAASSDAPGAGSPAPAAVSNPVKVPPKGVRFRDLKKDWDKELIRSENAAGAVYARRPGETREEFEAARATPFDHLAAMDREVELARGQQRTGGETCAAAV